MAMMKPKSDQPRASAAKMMGHILAMNKNPNVGLKNNNQPPRGISNVTAYAKGGAVKKSVVKAKDANKSTVKAPKKVVKGSGKAASKDDGDKDTKGVTFAKGGKVKCLAAGGAAKVRRSSPKPKPIKMITPRGG